MPERERERRGTQEEQDKKEEVGVKWRISGKETEGLSVEKGTKLSDLLKRRGHESLRGKVLTRNGKVITTDEDGNLKEDPELQEDDVIQLFEAKITKGICLR